MKKRVAIGMTMIFTGVIFWCLGTLVAIGVANHE